MGGMVMGKCEDRQRKSCIVQTYYKYFKRKYRRLQLGDVYTCHGFFQRLCEFEKADSKTFFHKLIQLFVNKGFGNYWQLAINRIHKTSKTIICKSKQVNLGATII
jgi:hypothetical protein